MVKAEMLYQLDFRLQEITQKDVPFGGVSLFFFGDLMQLQPVQGRFIFDKPKGEEEGLQEIHECEPRWNMFHCVQLVKNHRQGKDKAYADLLNRIRVGEHTEEDIDLLESRVRKISDEDVKNADLFIGAKRKECARLNDDYIFKQMKNNGKLIKIKSFNYNSLNKDFRPCISEKDGAIGSTQFQNVLFLRIGAKVMVIHNVDTLDGITNGQAGILVGVLFKEDEKVDKLIIELKNKSSGKLNRQKHPLLASKYPNCIFLERTSFQYSIRNKSGQVGSTATVVQFPIRVRFHSVFLLFIS